MSDQRIHKRVAIAFSCRFSTVDQELPANTENLSLGGTLVRLTESAQHLVVEGDLAECHFQIENDDFYIPSEVKRIDGHSVAMEFTKLRPEQIQQLKNFIALNDD